MGRGDDERDGKCMEFVGKAPRSLNLRGAANNAPTAPPRPCEETFHPIVKYEDTADVSVQPPGSQAMHRVEVSLDVSNIGLPPMNPGDSMPALGSKNLANGPVLHELQKDDSSESRVSWPASHMPIEETIQGSERNMRVQFRK